MGHSLQSRVLLQRAHQLYSTARIAPSENTSPFQLALFSDRVRVPNLDQLLLSLPRQYNTIALIYRDYDMPLKDREDLGRRLRQICQQKHVLFFVAGDIALAQQLRADGVHLPEWQLLRGKKVPPPFLTSTACHSPRALILAEKQEITAAFISPVFRTNSHPNAVTLGSVKLAQMVCSTQVPIYALGGITAATSRRLTGTGIAGFGAIDGLIKPPV